MEIQAISSFFPGFKRPLGYGLSLNKQTIVLDPTLVHYCVRQLLLLTFGSNSNDKTVLVQRYSRGLLFKIVTTVYIVKAFCNLFIYFHKLIKKLVKVNIVNYKSDLKASTCI